MPRFKGRRFSQRLAVRYFDVFRQRTDVNTAVLVLFHGFPGLYINIMPRMDGSANVIDCISHCHADIVSCLHVPADAIEGAVPGALHHNILRRVGIPIQKHILTGVKNKGSLGAIPAQHFNFPVLIRQMPYQKSQTSFTIYIGKFRIPKDACG